MDNDRIRVWGPVVAVLLLLPLLFVLLRLLLPPIGPRERALQPAPEQPALAPRAQGSASCEGCHGDIYRAWSASSHGRAEMPLGPEHPLASVLASVEQDGARLSPVRSLGVAPVIQLLVPRDNGRLQVTSRAYDPGPGEWFEVFPDARSPGDWGHWTGGGMTWNSQCAGCHSTGVEKGWDEQQASYDTRADEHGVGCAACHGALPEHGAQGSPPLEATVPDLDTCAACHSRRADLTGHFLPGDAFLDHFAPQLVDLGETFYADGQVREEDFEWTAFVGSKMHAKGVSCGSCHDPHTGKTRAEGDALCLGCHSALPGFALHDRHPEGASVGCVGCHMPLTTYMQRDARHDHGFILPDPQAGLELSIPDPCVRCHSARDPKKDARWALAAYRRWWGEGELASQRRERARLTAAARSGAPEAAQPLIARLQSGEAAAWRASAASLLERYADREDTRAALVAALSDPEPLVRFAASGALAPVAPEPTVEAALLPLLGDPLRAVRVSAARSLRYRLSPSDTAASDYVSYLSLASDTPTGLLERGSWSLERGDSASAVRDLARAVGMDPKSPALRDAHAVALASYGRPADAVAELLVAVSLSPDDPELKFRLALGQVGAGDLAAAERSLDEAAKLDASNARIWYNLGLLRQQLGQREPAVAALRRAVELSADPETRYALASTLLAQGRAREAREQALSVLAERPDHRGALQIRAQTE